MTVQKVKPRFRGVSHLAAFFVVLGPGALFVAMTPAGAARASAAVFVVSLVWQLGVSALYHWPMWSLAMRERLKRLDHASIFVLIVGSYTPVCLLALPPADGHPLLLFVCCGAALGVVMALVWPHRPRAFSVAVYVALSASAFVYVRAVFIAVGAGSFTLLLLGGVVYFIGAVIYALRRPNPNPAVFGYHEVFHALVVVACAMHFAAIVRVVGAHGG